MIRCYVGPMWSGKTTKQLELLQTNEWSDAEIIEPSANTRNSERDLSSKFEVSKFPGKVSRSSSHYIIDEVHLFEVFGEIQLFLALFHDLRINDASLSLSGISFDCYNDYRLFPIWLKIFPYADQVFWLKSFISCNRCGADPSESIYTTNLSSCQEIVGDNYTNICALCVEKERTKRREANIA